MLAANVCAADFIQEAQHPGLFRVHEGPTPEKKEILRGYLKAMGVGMTISDDPTPGEFQKIALATKDRPDAQQISTMLLRSMQQAIYTPINSGHFGLAYEAYTHFTSPIRRYPDLLVHRVIKAILAKERYQLPCCRRRARRTRSWRAARVARGAADPEAQAQGRRVAARDAGLGGRGPALQRQRAPRRRGQPRRRGLAQVQVHARPPRRGVLRRGHGRHQLRHLRHAGRDVRRGLVHITELGGEYFKFDEARQELRGERTGIRYAIGTRLRVQVSRVDLDGRKIDFRLVREDEELVARAMKEKGVAPAGARACRPRPRPSARPRRPPAKEKASPLDAAKAGQEGGGQDAPRARAGAEHDHDEEIHGDECSWPARSRSSRAAAPASAAPRAALLGAGWRVAVAGRPSRCRRW